MKVLSPAAHGVLDYMTVVFFALAPFLFELTGAYATACYVLAGGYLLITLATDFPLGVMRIIPFPVHGAFELVSGLALLAAPFIFGFSDDNPTARNLFIGSGVVFTIVWFLTDWRAQSQGSHTRSLMTDTH